MNLQEAVAAFRLTEAILYHISKRPAAPKPAQSRAARGYGKDGRWIRPGREPVANGVFLTPDPVRTSHQHSRSGHVYAYDVPAEVIKAAGGIRTFDRGPELLVPDHLWDKVKFLGKSMSKEDLSDLVSDAQTKRRRDRRYQISREGASSKPSETSSDPHALAAAIARSKQRPLLPRPTPPETARDRWLARRGK